MSAMCLCGGRGWFEDGEGDRYCECDRGAELRKQDEEDERKIAAVRARREVERGNAESSRFVKDHRSSATFVPMETELPVIAGPAQRLGLTEDAFMREIFERCAGNTAGNSVADVVREYVEAGVPRERLLYWLGRWESRGWYGRFLVPAVDTGFITLDDSGPTVEKAYVAGDLTNGTFTRAGIARAADLARGDKLKVELKAV